MPTSRPNNAPENLGSDARDRDSASAVMNEEARDQPGGGGLGGQSAAEGAPDATRTNQAATPSNPDSPAVAGDSGSLKAQEEAQHLTSGDAAEPKPIPRSE